MLGNYYLVNYSGFKKIKYNNFTLNPLIQEQLLDRARTEQQSLDRQLSDMVEKHRSTVNKLGAVQSDLDSLTLQSDLNAREAVRNASCCYY